MIIIIFDIKKYWPYVSAWYNMNICSWNQTPNGGQNLQKFFFYTFKILIAILEHLEAKFDNTYFIVLFLLGFNNSTQKISTHFEPNWRRNGRRNILLFLNFLSEKSSIKIMKTSWRGRAVTYHWGVVKTLRSHRYIVLKKNR